MASSHALVGSEKHVIVPFSSEVTVLILAADQKVGEVPEKSRILT